MADGEREWDRTRVLTQVYWSQMDERLCMEEDFVGWFGTRALTRRCKIESKGERE